MTLEQAQLVHDSMTRVMETSTRPFVPYYTVKPKGETTYGNEYHHKSDTCAVHEAG